MDLGAPNIRIVCCKTSMGPYGQQKQKFSNDRIVKGLYWTFFALNKGGMYSVNFTALCLILFFAKKCINTCIPKYMSKGELFKFHIAVQQRYFVRF